MGEQEKDIKISQENWLKIMNRKNKYRLTSANKVISAYHKMISKYKLEQEFKETAKKYG